MSEWAARVRSLAAKCEFGSELQVAMRDKFIMGLENFEIMGGLFEEKVSISFDNVVEIANNQVGRHVMKEMAVKEEIFYHGHVQRRSGARNGNRKIKHGEGILIK